LKRDRRQSRAAEVRSFLEISVPDTEFSWYAVAVGRLLEDIEPLG
jgi:hypothetical protein